MSLVLLGHLEGLNHCLTITPNLLGLLSHFLQLLGQLVHFCLCLL